LASFGESLQVVTSPCCPRQLPDVILRTFPWMLDPVPRRYTVCLHLFLPRCHRPSPKRHGSASRVCPANNDFSQALFRGCRYSVMFRPPSLLAPQIVPTAANTSAGQPGLLRPSRTRFVASPRIGYANRLKTGNWRYRDFHPVRLSALSAAPSPGRALPLRRRSYWLMRRSRWALSSFGFLASLESPCRLLPVPAAHGSFPTLFPRTFPWMLDPLPRRYTVCSHLFLPRCHRPSPSD